MAPQTQRNLLRILPFGIIWLLMGWLFLFTEYVATDRFSYKPEGAISPDLSVFIFASFAVAAVGLLIGALEVYWLNGLFSHRSFTAKLLYKSLLYGLFLLSVVVVTFIIAVSLELAISVFHPQVWSRLFAFFTSLTFASTAVQIGSSLFVSLFYFEISENIGPGILLNFFSGKYHSPLEEERIFMFLDMKSSTTIAERLGHIRYFALLKQYYADLSDAIVVCRGEVYQYIGDEIVISWPMQQGLREANCVRCFFAMRQALAARAPFYRQHFGETPAFKAGLHYGEVTTGEIGALKKEIIFTGDVLNTTARIQALCNSLGKDLLISQTLADLLQLPQTYTVCTLGPVTLRGKEKQVMLASVSLAGISSVS